MMRWHFFKIVGFDETRARDCRRTAQRDRAAAAISLWSRPALSYPRTDAPTLSGGESQSVRLASQIGSGLVGATYVLDEPSIGLHPRDNAKLLADVEELAR